MPAKGNRGKQEPENLTRNEVANAKMITRLLFRLLPVQVLLAVVGAVNGIVSSFFASNYVGIDAMGAVGLYSPLSMLLGAISTMLVGGSMILCGKYLGRNEQEKLQNNFSLNFLISVLISIVFFVLFVVLALFNLTGFFTTDQAIRPIFNRYLLGQAIGILPMILGNLLTAFLSMENKTRRTTIASLVYIVVNVLLNLLFVQVLKMEAFGLALATSIGQWVFFLIQVQYFVSKKAHIRLRLPQFSGKETGEILKVGFPGAASYGYQTIRGLIMNALMTAFIGSVGISAYATTDNLLRIFWAIPSGMLAVSRMMISVSIGEEDRQTLTDVMRVMFRKFLLLMGCISLVLVLLAVPLTRIFFRDPAEPVYMMTVWGFRIVPLCMPLSIICMHFVCYGQASDKNGLVHVLSLLDGLVCVAGFAALLIGPFKMPGVYAASVLNGVVTTLVIIGYAWLKNRHCPRNMEELMAIPENFGVSEEERMDLTIYNIEEVVHIAQRVQDFCEKRGIDSRRSYLAGLSLEEMAGNIVDHGYTKDKKKHTIDVRIVHKDDDVILRIKDDCVPFDPKERSQLTEGDGITKNIGIRMVYQIAKDIQYQNILGLNVLTIRV